MGKKWTKIFIKENRVRRLQKYKMLKGCEKCGYNKHPAALTFDHLDPLTKRKEVKNGGSKNRGGGMWNLCDAKYSVKELIDEVRKCRILCFNHHMEERYKDNPLYNLDSKSSI